MIPVRTVCSIIDVDFKSQDNWIKGHPFYGQLYSPSTTTGADGKQYQMNCLSIFDIDGWLNSIGPKGRKEGSLEKQYVFMAWLRETKMELYKAIDVFIQENHYELDLIDSKGKVLDEIEENQTKSKDLKKQLGKINMSLDEVRAKRYTGQTALKFPEN